MRINMLNLFRNSTMSDKEKFLHGLKCKGLKTLNNKRARLLERFAFSRSDEIRNRNLDMLRAVEDEIKRRGA